MKNTGIFSDVTARNAQSQGPSRDNGDVRSCFDFSESQISRTVEVSTRGLSALVVSRELSLRASKDATLHAPRL